MHLRTISSLTPRPLTWLWPKRLALGKLAMLDGDPGLGKSLLALDLCARLSTGRPFPDDSPGPGPAGSLLLSAEDGEHDTTRPRLQALGADLDRVFVLRPDDVLGRPLRLPAQLGLLDDALARTGALLMVLDPVIAFLDASACISNDQAIRQVLTPLALLAHRHACAVLLVRHLNKQAGARALYRGGGSIGLLGACRSGWLVARDPSDPDRRVLAQTKNNLAPPQPSLAFTVESSDGIPRLCWQGLSLLTADDLLSARPPPEPVGRPRDRARAFLSAILEDGPQTVRAIWEAACEQGLSERTLYRARRQLQIRAETVEFDGLP